LSRAEGAGLNAGSGQFNICDTFVSPVWLDWSGKHYDTVAIYGFYIPTGKYHIDTVNVQVVGPVRVASPDNIGLGFWENQTQAALYLYPWADKRMAVENALTWEINRRKRGSVLPPGHTPPGTGAGAQTLPLRR